MAAIMLQTIPSFYGKISEKSLFISAKTYENTLFVDITLYYLEKLRNCYINWIHFVSPINTWTVFIPCSITDSAEKLLHRVEMCLTMCREQSLLAKETEE